MHIAAIHINVLRGRVPRFIHRVLNDVTGVGGLKILDAILAGERDPLTLARLCHGRVKNSEDTIAKSLEGDWPPPCVWALNHCITLKALSANSSA
jgi:transposase